MPDNVLIPLPGFQLPGDFPWRVGLVAMVDDQLRRLRATGHFLPPRFFGYYFQADVPVGVGGSWTVSLDRTQPALLIPTMLDELTHGQYSITSADSDSMPEYLLVHDRRDGACWLWSFDDGLRFVESVEPVTGRDGTEAPKLFGP
jgi:hypothetical protein